MSNNSDPNEPTWIHGYHFFTLAVASLGTLLEIFALRVFYTTWSVKDPPAPFIINFFKTICYLLMNLIALSYIVPIGFGFVPPISNVLNNAFGLLFMRTIYIYLLPLLVFSYIDRIMAALGDLEYFFTGIIAGIYCFVMILISSCSFLILLDHRVTMVRVSLTFVYERRHCKEAEDCTEPFEIGFPTTVLVFYCVGVLISVYCVVRRHLNTSYLLYVSNDQYNLRWKAAMNEFYSTMIDSIIFVLHWILILVLGEYKKDARDEDFGNFFLGTLSHLLVIFVAS